MASAHLEKWARFRQPHFEGAALPGALAPRADLTAVQLDEPADECETDPQPAGAGVCRSITLDDQSEQFGQQIRRDANPGIADAKHGVVFLDADALGALTAYHWPGNIRELENIDLKDAASC